MLAKQTAQQTLFQPKGQLKAAPLRNEAVHLATRPSHSAHEASRHHRDKEHRHGEGYEKMLEKALAKIEPHLKEKGHRHRETRLSALDLMFCSKLDARYACPFYVNNQEITPLRNTAVRKDHTVSACRDADTG